MRFSGELQDQCVLIVDDEGAPGANLAAGFRRLGWEAWIAVDAATALVAAARNAPSLIVMESRLAGSPTVELLEVLLSRLPGTRPVVVTGYGSIAGAVRAVRMGAKTYLSKPATADQVLQAVGEAVGDPRAERPPRRLTLDQAIWEYINQTVDEAGSIAEAARQLGLERRSLRRMLAKYAP